MIPIYTGFDPREEAGTHVFVSSVIERATSPVAIMPLHLPMFQSFYRKGQRDGTNNFIYTRFLAPFLQNFTGWAVFVDGADMLMRADISELWALRDHYKAVQVVQHSYKTKHQRKYIGTKMEAKNDDYPRKNWSSVMLINCAHFAWRDMRPEVVENMPGAELHRFDWMDERFIGELPAAWNWLADEYGESADAKLLHWTCGSPAFEHYKNSPHAADFMAQMARMNYVTS